MKRGRWLLVVSLATSFAQTACSGTTSPGDAGVDATDASITDVATDIAHDVASDVVAADTPDVGPDASTCGASVCTGAQVCCPFTMECYDPTCLACCMEGVDAAVDTGMDTATHDAMPDDVVLDVTADTGGGTCGSTGTCTVGLTCCTGECRNFDNDPINCGSCGHTCTGATSMCSGGTCTIPTCAPACATTEVCCLVNHAGPIGPPECDPGPSCPVGCPACL